MGRSCLSHTYWYAQCSSLPLHNLMPECKDECVRREKEGVLMGLGTKFIVLHSLGHAGLDDLMRRIYEICESYPSQPHLAGMASFQGGSATFRRRTEFTQC